MHYGHRQINFSQCVTIFINRVLQLQLKIVHTRALGLNSNLSWGLHGPRDCFYKLCLLPTLHFLAFISLLHVFKKQLDSFQSVEKRQSKVL